VLLPVGLSVYSVPAPVAYTLRVGRLTILVANREAITGDVAPLLADGTCFDAIVLPARADPAAATALVQGLRPRLVVLPQAQRAATPMLAAQLGPLPAGVRLWTAAEGTSVAMSSRDGRCSAPQIYATLAPNR
jgi:hypothetical protein